MATLQELLNKKNRTPEDDKELVLKYYPDAFAKQKENGNWEIISPSGKKRTVEEIEAEESK